MPPRYNEGSPEFAGWRWDHSYARLPEMFLTRTLPVPVANPQFAIFNGPLAGSLGLDPDVLKTKAGIFAGNELPEGAEPLAQAYAGHQFGGFTNLGDGRAVLLGEHLDPSGTRFDIQLKGSGRTRYSRGGDGRATLGPMLREYIISEAMHALGIPTTRSLAVATTGEKVMRDKPLPGAVLTRVAASHIRVGTFEYAAAHDNPAALKALADYTVQRHFPDLVGSDRPYFHLLERVLDRQADLTARWLHVGFIHGVMNTDNMALSGETIDYGPCAFMDDYNPAAVFSSIDQQGRYAYGQQPQIALWNTARLAESVLPLLHEDEESAVDLANEVLSRFEELFRGYWLSGMRYKLGLSTAEADDAPLVQELLDWMHTNRMDFTNTFRGLSDEAVITSPPYIEPGFSTWHARWVARLARQPQSPAEVAVSMRSRNPAIIPRNHKIEEALAAAVEHGDFNMTHQLLEALANPFSSAVPAEYTVPPAAGTTPYQTFCGT